VLSGRSLAVAAADRPGVVLFCLVDGTQVKGRLTQGLGDTRAARGAVVVGSANGPVDEVIQHGHNGLLVPFAAHDQLAATLLQVLVDPAAHAHLGVAARATVEQRYTLAACASGYEQLASSLRLV